MNYKELVALIDEALAQKERERRKQKEDWGGDSFFEQLAKARDQAQEDLREYAEAVYRAEQEGKRAMRIMSPVQYAMYATESGFEYDVKLVEFRCDACRGEGQILVEGALNFYREPCATCGGAGKAMLATPLLFSDPLYRES